MIAVYVENEGATLPKSSLVCIAAAQQAKEKHGYSRIVGVLAGGAVVDEAAARAAAYGLDEVVYIRSDKLEQYLAVPYAASVSAALKELGPKLVLASSNSRGKDLMPRIAHALGAGQASDVIAFLDAGRFQRPMYAGNIIADVEITTPVKTATVRTSAFDAASEQPSKGTVREIAAPALESTGQRFVSFDTVASERPDLADAEIVVSGGRAMKSAENFEKYIAPLADALGAAIGASRAAVDSGYAPNDWQVGQTGKVVAPSLYIAIGISGAIQHLAGMKDSKVIVAINSDPEAPIFEVADYGLVADLYDAVPKLTEAITRERG